MLVDAADFGGKPGEAQLLEPELLLAKGISTHDMSLQFFIDSLQGEGGITVSFLAFQPQSTRLGYEPSREVIAGARNIAAGLGLLPKKNTTTEE